MRAAQGIVLRSGSGSEVPTDGNPKSAEFVQLLFVIYRWLLLLIIFWQILLGSQFFHF